MKRVLICVSLIALMLTGMLSVQAAEPEMTVQVLVSESQVQVGDTVEYTVLATGTGVVALQFNLQLPEGLSYVTNSGKTPDQLAQKLGVAATDWTEHTMMFTMYNDVSITIPEETEILRFSCLVTKEGQWTVNLFELLPFNDQFEEFTPVLHVKPVTTLSEPTTSTPAVTEPTTGVSTEQPQQGGEQQTITTDSPDTPVTQPVTDPEQSQEQAPTQNQLPEDPDKPQSDHTSEIFTPEQTEDQQEELVAKSNDQWKKITIVAFIGIVILSAAAVILAKVQKAKKTQD